MAGHERAVSNNTLMVYLLQLLMDAYVLAGNFKAQNGRTWCSKQAAHDYFEYVRFRVCPVSGDYPDLKQCLNSEWQARASWLPHPRAGKTLTEAIELTVSERHGAWAWATSVVAAQ